jgi:hypothetical protein
MVFSPWITEDAKQRIEKENTTQDISHIITDGEKAILLSFFMGA